MIIDKQLLKDIQKDAIDKFATKLKEIIKEETKCPYGNCVGDECSFDTDCMMLGAHILYVIDKCSGEL